MASTISMTPYWSMKPGSAERIAAKEAYERNLAVRADRPRFDRGRLREVRTDTGLRGYVCCNGELWAFTNSTREVIAVCVQAGLFPHPTLTISREGDLCLVGCSGERYPFDASTGALARAHFHAAIAAERNIRNTKARMVEQNEPGQTGEQNSEVTK